ncbi:MAG: redoxin domain-containing protein [Gemmatimonadaceae bacterium]|nr:redoxin domain-containing protein [Gemmatimonadaceae bacterium]
MNRRRATLAALGALPVVALFAWGMGRDPGEIPSPLPGHQAPSFALAVFTNGLGGTPKDSVRLQDWLGDPVVLNVWASWCLACRDEHPALLAVGRRYADTDVHFVGLLYNDTPEAGRAWLQEMGGQAYPSVLDPGARTAIAYGVYGVPETYFIGRDGRVAHKHTGPVTERVLEDWIARIRSTPAVPGNDTSFPRDR